MSYYTFKRKTYEKLFKIGVVNSTEYNDKAIITITLGLTEYADKKEIYEVELGTYNLDDGIIKESMKVFLVDIEEVVSIKEIIPKSDGGYIVYIEDKLVETENTSKTHMDCVNEILNYNKQKDEYEKLKKEFDDYKNEYKYKHKFFNF